MGLLPPPSWTSAAIIHCALFCCMFPSLSDTRSALQKRIPSIPVSRVAFPVRHQLNTASHLAAVRLLLYDDLRKQYRSHCSLSSFQLNFRRSGEGGFPVKTSSIFDSGVGRKDQCRIGNRTFGLTELERGNLLSLWGSHGLAILKRSCSLCRTGVAHWFPDGQQQRVRLSSFSLGCYGQVAHPVEVKSACVRGPRACIVPPRTTTSHWCVAPLCAWLKEWSSRPDPHLARGCKARSPRPNVNGVQCRLLWHTYSMMWRRNK